MVLVQIAVLVLLVF